MNQTFLLPWLKMYTVFSSYRIKPTVLNLDPYDLRVCILSKSSGLLSQPPLELSSFALTRGHSLLLLCLPGAPSPMPTSLLTAALCNSLHITKPDSFPVSLHHIARLCFPLCGHHSLKLTCWPSVCYLLFPFRTEFVFLVHYEQYHVASTPCLTHILNNKNIPVT